ncbi:hypothetical protein Lser_V15G19420 [Lactuca serriola]
MLGHWHASVEDYDILTKEEPGDEGLSQAFREAKEHLQKHLADLIK